jgi:hypothetical protein
MWHPLLLKILNIGYILELFVMCYPIIVVLSSCYCYPLFLLYTHLTSTTLFLVLSKQSVLVLSFEFLMDNSVDQDDLNKTNICSLCNFRTSTKKTLNPCNFCIQYLIYTFFSVLESSCICQSEYLKIFQV